MADNFAHLALASSTIGPSTAICNQHGEGQCLLSQALQSVDLNHVTVLAASC